MKKFVLITLVLTIATTFAFAAFLAPTASGVAVEAPQAVSFRIAPPFQIIPPWLPQPNVGWNS